MKIELGYIDEPLLQFGRERHPDIRYGIMNFGPFDVREKRRPASIKLGVVGTPASVTGLNRWLEQCRTEVVAKDSPKKNLFAPFPGFSRDSPFEAEIILDRSLNSEIQPEDITKLESIEGFNDRVRSAVTLFMPALQNA